MSLALILLIPVLDAAAGQAASDQACPVHQESINSQLRIAMFNALNPANFGTPNIVIVDRQGRLTGNAGQITSTSTDSRRIRFGLTLNFWPGGKG